MHRFAPFLSALSGVKPGKELGMDLRKAGLGFSYPWPIVFPNQGRLLGPNLGTDRS
jgi:hypothetical protein